LWTDYQRRSAGLSLVARRSWRPPAVAAARHGG
jgi:hypothetical protein